MSEHTISKEEEEAVLRYFKNHSRKFDGICDYDEDGNLVVVIHSNKTVEKLDLVNLINHLRNLDAVPNVTAFHLDVYPDVTRFKFITPP